MQTLTAWAHHRTELLAEDHASAAMIRGYLDYASGIENVSLFVGEPFNADDYHAGMQLASYEMGPLNTEEEIAA